jgi:purine-cytosine permease-like protein
MLPYVEWKQTAEYAKWHASEEREDGVSSMVFGFAGAFGVALGMAANYLYGPLAVLFVATLFLIVGIGHALLAVRRYWRREILDNRG